MDPIPPKFCLSSYDYSLPPEQIAQVPAPERTGSRLMVLDRRGGVRAHARFEDLPAYLREGDCLVVNDTRVIPARLFARKETGGMVEVLTVRFFGERLEAMVHAHRGLRPGATLEVVARDGGETGIRLRVEARTNDGRAVLVVTHPPGMVVSEVMDRCGRIPLPPYIQRSDASLHDLDRERYQTVYARSEGAIAAPTAGLHFDEDLLARLGDMGVQVVPVTLHVGPGTFRPIRAEDIRRHRVDPERFEVPPASARAINEAIQERRRVVAVGTTVVRVLETLGGSRRGLIEPRCGETDLTILPGHRFRVVSALITNFHLPRSSLLALVCAFAGRQRVLRAYREAVRLGYRFYSYGDAMFIA